MEKKKSKFTKVAIPIVLLLALLMAFMLGTVVGFKVAYNSLSDCIEVPCETLGVIAERCELCPDTLRILDG